MRPNRLELGLGVAGVRDAAPHSPSEARLEAADAVRVRGVEKRFGSRSIFHGRDLSAARGERLALLAACGCGKSTLLRLIVGLAAPDRGSIDVAGDVGIVFQEPRLFPGLSVEANVAFAARTRAERERVGELIGLSASPRHGGSCPKHSPGHGPACGALRAGEPVVANDPTARAQVFRALGIAF